MKCTNCGYEFEKGNFCPECGTKKVEVCQNCGHEIANNSKFCAGCGKQVKIVKDKGRKDYNRKRNKNKKGDNDDDGGDQDFVENIFGG
jgi:rRNA maturation endonuclease Nob1